MTARAAKAVKADNNTDLAGEAIGSKIPKATPVFLTYVMLKKPSITEIDSLSSNRLLIRTLVQRSSNSVTVTRSRYGSRPWSLNDMRQNYIRRTGQRTRPMVFLGSIFPPRFR